MVHLSDAQVDLRVVDGLHASSIHVPNAGLQDTRVLSNTFIQSVEGERDSEFMLNNKLLPWDLNRKI